MNLQAIRILFLKDLFLSRRFLFAYFAAGLAASALTCSPNATVSFLGFILILTVAIGSGVHFIGNLLLGESTDQTRLFVLSFPVSLLDYSIGKILVVLITFLIPWTAMFVCSSIGTLVLPWAKVGSMVVLPPIFFYLLSSFTLQLVMAVITDSVGWTICAMVASNVFLNIFIMKLLSIPEVDAIKKADVLSWPPVVLQIVLAEVLIFVVALAVSFVIQTRKRDLI